MKKVPYLLWLLLPAVILMAASCRKNALNDLTQEESRIYVTNRDSTADFSAFRTFSIVDSVAVIENDEQPHRELTEDDAHLLDLVKQQMEARGYVQVGKDQKPDLGINVTRVSNDYLNVVQYPYYWWNSPGYWDPTYWGYGGYDYYFPPVFGYYQSREDLLTIDLIDLAHAKTDDKLVGVWNATLKGEGVLNAANYSTEIQAVFDQSPYLSAGK